MKQKSISIFISFIFFIVSFLTISDYGINWDSPNHFNRGQAYLNYYLSGRTDYQNIKNQTRISYYQDKSESAAYYLGHDSAHPPLNGIFSAIFNKVFYQKLGILGDIESYHLFIITASAFLVFIITMFAAEAYGIFAGFVAGITIATYPLFFAESHFNIKDPVETVFFGATIYYFWKSTKEFNWRYLLLSITFFAFAFGTKFNILFLPFIIFPWLVLRFKNEIYHPIGFISRIPRKYIILLICSPFIVLAIFYASWPYLWSDPIMNFFDAFNYYYDIGTDGSVDYRFLFFDKFNLFPFVWIILTTPPVVLFLCTLGVINAFYRWKQKEKTALLWILWLVVPILRVSLPHSSIYGGVRQIMEFIPAIALLTGLGALLVKNQISRVFSLINIPKQYSGVIILLFFVPHILVMKNLHPNENVYFNFLIGGIKGAKEQSIPYWGNSFGNAYLQAVNWLNDNAPVESKLALVQSTERSVPRLYLNPKIVFSNGNWSAFDKQGEYLVELTHNGNIFAYPWVWEYVNKVLIPVHEIEVDGVAIAKIWKNDIEHSKTEYQNEINLDINKISILDNSVLLELKNTSYVSRLKVLFKNNTNICLPLKSATVFSSIDREKWLLEPNIISFQQVSKYSSLDESGVNYMFPARQAKYVKIDGVISTCFMQYYNLSLYGFEI